MGPYPRYAIYFTPAPGAFADTMARWLGWDPATGRPGPRPDLPGLPAPAEEITASPRRYGFHATLKPPFRLASGSSPTRLRADLAALAAAVAPAQVPGLKLARLGGFLALVPEGDSTGLARIAAETVAGLDHHRAPAPAEEVARRRAAGLSPRQAAHLATWGYPYVMDEYRFHLTLTGRLDPPALAATATALEGLIAPVLPQPFAVDALSLMGEDGEGYFHLLHRVPLTG